MAKQDLENLSTHELKKKKRFGSFLLGILVGVQLVSFIVGAAARRPELFAVAAALFAVGFPMYVGMNRVDAELHRREDR